MKYLKKFEEKLEYIDYIDDSSSILPNVSYVKELKDTKYNAQRKAIHYVLMKASAAQTVTAPSGSSMEYSYNLETWSAMTAAVSFGTEGKERVYIRGKNAAGFSSQSFIFGTSAMVDISGNAMALLDWETLPMAMPSGGFNHLFINVTVLRNVSSKFLPATTLASHCYCDMFNGCINLRTAPELPAETLQYKSYYRMFRECKNLNEIHCSATTISADDCTYHWLHKVASKGNFYGKITTNWAINSPDGIPTGWVWAEQHSIQLTAASAQTVTAPLGSNMEYSYDEKNWTTMTSAVNFGTDSATTVYIRGKNASGLNSQSFVFGTSAKVSLGGNCQALLDWDNLPTAVPVNGFTKAFCGATITAITNNILPATTLGNNCYESMFRNSNLSVVPKTLLPATELADGCYDSMFMHCGGITTGPDLPAEVMKPSCYNNLFFNTRLTTVPTMSATTLATYCFNAMLTATNIATVPTDYLPVTTLENGCYRNMFWNCKLLTQAPYLPATELKSYSYNKMFNGCVLLAEVHCDATNISAGSCTELWLNEVASAGTFYGKSSTPWVIDSPNGIPSGWTHINKTSIQMTASAAQTVTKPEGSTMEYSYDGKVWSSMTTAVEFGTTGKETVYVRGKNTSGINAAFKFSDATAMVDVEGNAMTLLDWETPPTKMPSRGFKNLFIGAAALRNVSSEFLPATILDTQCYYCMFNGCTNLKTPPELPAKTVGTSCYEGMFMDCTSLIKAPYLPAKILRGVNYCYRYMFRGCSNLNEIHCDAENIVVTVLANWVEGVASTGDFYGKEIANWTDGVSGIPSGWTKHLEE